MAVSEKKLLKPKDETIHQDDWPQFELDSAEVLSPKTGKLASIFDAGAEKPLTITGSLSIPHSQRKLFINQGSKSSSTVKITNVQRYSIGQFDNGSPVVWALGRAGWYELQPSARYKRTYDNDMEAIFVYYFLKDAHQWSSSRCSSMELFNMELARDFPKRVKDTKEAEQLIYRHWKALEKEFNRDDSESLSSADPSFRWDTTPIYLHMKQEIMERLPTSRRSQSSKGSRSDRSVSSTQQRPVRANRLSTESELQQDDSTIVSIASSLSASPRRRSPRHERDADLPTPKEIFERARALLDLLTWLHTKKSIYYKELTVLGFSKILHEMFSGFRNPRIAAHYLYAHAQDLVANMESSVLDRDWADWTESPIYAELNTAKLPASLRRKMLLLKPVRRDQDTDKPAKESSSTDVSEEQIRPARSGLRLKGSKFAGKARAREKGKMQRGSDEATQDDIGVYEDAKAAQPLKRQSKRKADATETVESNAVSRKRKASRSLDAQLVQFDSINDGCDDSASQDELLTVLPLRQKDVIASVSQKATARAVRGLPIVKDPRSGIRPPTPPAVPPIISTPAPCPEPNEVGGAWLCEVDGCTYKVYGAEHGLGKSLVHKHIEEHENNNAAELLNKDDGSATDDDSRENKTLRLIRREQEACRLPVNNLIKRIREMAAEQQVYPVEGLFNSPVFPLPITQMH